MRYLQLSLIESTYKSRETEETLDIYFYRPLGYFIALLSKKIGLTPNMISILGLISGVIAGHLFYYDNLNLNIWGVILLIISETLDSTDGQLARMTKRYSKTGRILDGVVTNFIFISIYIHICLRMINSGFPVFIFIIAIISGMGHSLQSAMADYYRNAYLKFTGDTNKGEFDKSDSLKKSYINISWRNSFIEKLFMWFYINYTQRQESLSKNFINLVKILENKLNSISPQWLKNEYRKINKPLLKWYNILTSNTRMIVLCIAVLIGKPIYYLLFELLILNLLLIFVLIKQEKNNKYLKNLIDQKTGVSNA
jgi:phosphatidylglycerophosphate synthase